MGNIYNTYGDLIDKIKDEDAHIRGNIVTHSCVLEFRDIWVRVVVLWRK